MIIIPQCLINLEKRNKREKIVIQGILVVERYEIVKSMSRVDKKK